MLNVKTLTDTMSRMELPQLQQYAALHKNDPYIVTLALSIANQKKQMKAGQAGQAGMMPQPKVADQQIAQMSAPSPQQMAQPMPEDQGIGTLPAQNMQNFAGGGITGQGGLQLNIPLDLGGDGGGYRGMGSTTANFPQSNGGFTGNNNAPQVTSNPSLVADQAQRLAQHMATDDSFMGRGLGAPQGPLLAGGSMGQFPYAAGGPEPQDLSSMKGTTFGGNPQQSMSQLMGLLGGKSMAGGGIVAFDDGGEVPGYAAGVFTKTDRKQEFAAKYRDAAMFAGQELGVDPGIIISQWGLETGWGKSIIPNTNNLGNIKDFSGKGVKAYDKEEKSNDRYRQYESPEAFAKDYVSLIKRKYPGSVGTGGDAKKFVAGLGTGKPGGYATDKNYTSKFLNTVGSFLPIATATAPEINKPTATAAPAPTTDQTSGKEGRTQAQADALFKKQTQDVKNLFTSSTSPSAAQAQGITALAGGDPMTGFTMPQDVFSPSPEEVRKYADAKVQAKKVEDVVSQIPGQTVKAPAFKDTNTYFGGVADELGISPEVQRNVANAINATSGFAGPVGGVNRAASTVSKGLEPTAEMIQKAAQAKQVADTVRLLPPAKAGFEGLDAASAATRAGAEQARRMRLLEQDRKAAVGAEQSVEAATKTANIADKTAKEIALAQDAARLNQAKMTGAAQGLAMTQAADKADLFPQGGGVSDLVPKTAPAMAPPLPPGILAPVAGEDIVDKIKEATGASTAELKKQAADSGMDYNSFLTRLGFGLMAGESQYASVNIGKAGLGALDAELASQKSRQAQAASASDSELKKMQAKYYGSYADAIERGAKEKNEVLQAETLVQQHIEKWLSSGPGLMATAQDPNATAKEEARFRKSVYLQLGLNPIMSSNTPAGGAKFLGFENPA